MVPPSSWFACSWPPSACPRSRPAFSGSRRWKGSLHPRVRDELPPVPAYPAEGGLSNYLFTNRKLDWDDKLESRVGELTAERVSAVMRKHLDPAKITVIKAGDFKKAAGSGN